MKSEKEIRDKYNKVLGDYNKANFLEKMKIQPLKLALEWVLNINDDVIEVKNANKKLLSEK